MEKLPPELVAEIFSHLSNNDILNLPTHLVASGLTEAAAHARFGGDYTLWLRISSLSRLLRLSRHPMIAKQVTMLCFTNERLVDIGAQQYADLYWDFNGGFMNDCRGPPIQDLDPHPASVAPFLKYRFHFEAQTKVEEQEEDVRILQLAVEAMPNVKSVIIDNLYWIDRRGIDEVLGNAFCCGIIEDPDDTSGAHLVEVLLKVLPASPFQISVLSIIYDSEWSLCLRNTSLCHQPHFTLPRNFSQLPPSTISTVMQSLRKLESTSVDS